MGLVVFDVGEVLVDESRLWLRRAAQLGIPPFTFLGVLGAVIGADRNHREVFDVFGVDAADFLADLDAVGDPADGILAEDLYPDVVPALAALVSAGHEVAVAANQPTAAAAALGALDVGVRMEVLVLSGIDGVAKPDVAFFQRLVARAGRPSTDITYVGDRLDNDVLPALAAGMQAVLVRRGPWGVLHARRPAAASATAVVTSLSELIPLLGPGGSGPRPRC